MISNNTSVPTVVMPAAERGGTSVATLNKYGWMSTAFMDPAPDFVKAAGASPHWSLDVGCAYGFYTLAAVQAGARVVANDLDEQHLAILMSSVPPEFKHCVQTICGAFPNVDLPSNHFGTILANRVLHFLNGDMLERAAEKMFQLLVPGGVAYVRTITPYIGTSTSFIPVYEKRKMAGERFPGFVPDFTEFVSHPRELEVMTGQIHMLEPDILSRTFSEAGFVIERSEYGTVSIEPYTLDGRETAIVVARKP